MNIKEIARQAQVSVATVSRVLNHPELVQPETRAHILEVMARHNYTPNWFARRLNLARTNTIALLVPNIEGGINQKVVAGVESVATKKREHRAFMQHPWPPRGGGPAAAHGV